MTRPQPLAAPNKVLVRRVRGLTTREGTLFRAKFCLSGFSVISSFKMVNLKDRGSIILVSQLKDLSRDRLGFKSSLSYLRAMCPLGSDFLFLSLSFLTPSVKWGLWEFARFWD